MLSTSVESWRDRVRLQTRSAWRITRRFGFLDDHVRVSRFVVGVGPLLSDEYRPSILCPLIIGLSISTSPDLEFIGTVDSRLRSCRFCFVLRLACRPFQPSATDGFVVTLRAG